jgi:pilus assembly protein CpaF
VSLAAGIALEEKIMSLKTRISQVLPRQESVESPDEGSKPVAQAATPLSIVTPQEQEWALNLHQRLVKVMDLSLITSMEEEQAREQIREVSQRLLAEEPLPLNEASRQRVLKLIEDEILGLGPLEPLLHDPSVSDIMVNGCNSV